MVTNWNEIFDVAGERTVCDFASGTLPVKTFRSTCPAARRLVENYRSEEARQLARRALNRRKRCST